MHIFLLIGMAEFRAQVVQLKALNQFYQLEG